MSAVRAIYLTLGLLMFSFTAQAQWPLWSAFKAGFVQDDGRVVDWTGDGRTVSEGQAYALFFALVAGDREQFGRILTWLENNLANGDLSTHLPAWVWGRDAETDNWRVLDANSASDADMFIAYSLLEAGRLWKVPSYTELGRQVLDQLSTQCIRTLEAQTVLLPAPNGFLTSTGVRLNPSYLPLFQMRRFALLDQRWNDIAQHAVAMIAAGSPRGLPPDWVEVTAQGFRPDAQTGTLGSYDAIRVFLWAAMQIPDDPISQDLLAVMTPVVRYLRPLGYMPERWDVATGWKDGIGPPGFDAVMAMFSEAAGARSLSKRFDQRVAAVRQGEMLGQPARYYDQVLALFAEGYRYKRFRFNQRGELVLP